MTITVDDLVNREVHYCVSYLVSELCQYVDNGPLGEQAFDLAAPIDDWEEAAREAGWKIVDRDPSEDRQNEDPCLYHEEQDRVWPLGDWQGACEDLDIEPYQREVYEHWIVSDWLADQLAARGEKVDKDFAGLTVWARTTTGQGIASDSVIIAIHAELTA